MQSKNTAGTSSSSIALTLAQRRQELLAEKSMSNRMPVLLLSSAISLEKLDCIRVIVHDGRGYGHQRAAITVMQKLREVKFVGCFDIRYYDSYPNSSAPNELKESVGSVGRRLKILISGFEPKDINSIDTGWKCLHPNLGAISVTRLPNIREHEKNHAIFPVKLTVSGAGEGYFSLRNRDLYNTALYVQLQPTGWAEESRYIILQNNEVIYLPKNLRLSSKNHMAIIPSDELKLTEIERNVISLCENKHTNSQLVYGLYPSLKKNPRPGQTRRTGSLDPVVELKNLIEAHRILQKKNAKPVVLFFPQKIFNDSSFQKNINISFDNIVWIDLTNPTVLESFDFSGLQKNTILMAYTGDLQPSIFDCLMLWKTTLPPVIEGCNSREACEFAGRPYIRGGSVSEPLDIYAMDEKHSLYQKLHAKASQCLSKGDQDDVPALAVYMEYAAFSEELREYHQQRQKAFLERPDAWETAWHKLEEKLRGSPIVMESSNSTDTQQVLSHNANSAVLMTGFGSRLHSGKVQLWSFSESADVPAKDKVTPNNVYRP